MRKKKSFYQDLEITGFSKKGKGVALLKREDCNEVKVEIPFTMPGDFINTLIYRKKRKVFVGKIETILQKASNRIEPKCSHFGECGGCSFQHIPYQEQLKNKEQKLIEIFKSLINPSVKIYPILKASSSFYYRNKCEFSFSSDREKNKYLGLIIEGSRGKVLNLKECHLANSWFIEGLKAIRIWWETSDLEAYHPSKNSGSLRTLTFREGKRTGDRMVVLTVSGNPDFALNSCHLSTFVKSLKESVEPEKGTLSIFLKIQQIAKGHETEMFEMHLSGRDHILEILKIGQEDKPKTELTFSISPQSFFQPNTEQAEKLYSKAIELAELKSEDIVLDLYCGTGTLGLSLAHAVKEVIGVEISPEATLDAKTNATRNNITNYRVYTGDVSKVLKENVLPTPDLILVDPPRAGLDKKAILEIVALKSKKIIYISCNPETQAENILELKQMGYKLIALQPVDQFPQTPHLENIALLMESNP